MYNCTNDTINLESYFVNLTNLRSKVVLECQTTLMMFETLTSPSNCTNNVFDHENPVQFSEELSVDNTVRSDTGQYSVTLSSYLGSDTATAFIGMFQVLFLS